MTDDIEVPVLDHGFVRLISQNASDQSVVNAARVSNGVIDAEWRGAKDESLIRFLLKHNHGTPFEHNQMVFLVRAPIFVVREWHRHRIGWSYNEVSGRYTELPEEFYVPERVRVPHPTNKQGSIEAEDDAYNAAYVTLIRDSAQSSFTRYRHMLSAGVAREVARLVLPLNTYTSFYATCNARSLGHFLNLRLDDGAQLEIRAFASAMESIWQELMPITHAAWRELVLSR